MANTGNKIVLTLKEIYDYNSLPTGATKDNISSDPDYVAPATDTVTCPVVYTTTCPVLIATGHIGNAEYEFALLNSVINNPAIAKVQVRLKSGTSTITSTTFVLPHSNYFTGTLSAAAGTYGIDVAYLDSSNAEVSVCTGLATVSIS